MRRVAILALAMFTACGRREATAAPPAAAAAVDPLEHRVLDGHGEPSSLSAFVSGLEDADLVAFGEFHRHPVGARYELELLEALANDPRPVALAMEFFEADTQAALDAYLAGEIDEATFLERTARDDAYGATHRPLIELCRERGLPVIAANAPRPLVTAYRKSGLSYAEYLAKLSGEERAWLPETTEITDDEFTERFLEFMGPERGPAFLPAMALWNDAMAESIAEFRAANPEHRVLLVVGGYHVAKHLGVVTRYLDRRPEDTARVLLMVTSEDGPLRLSDDDRGEGDLLLLVRPGE